MRIVYLVTCLFLLLSSSVLRAQNVANKIVSVDFSQASIKEVVSDLERQTGVYFYYDENQLDSLRFTAKINQKPFDFVLGQLFENTNCYFAIYQQQVFITRGNAISLAQANGAPANVAVPTLTNSGGQAVQDAGTPNKLYVVGIKSGASKKTTVTLTGFVREASGKAIGGASIATANPRVETLSNPSGFYSLTLPKGQHLLTIKWPDKNETQRQVLLNDNGQLNIELRDPIHTLREVEITAAKASNTKSVEMGVNRLDLKAIKKVPSLFGEPDVLRVILTLPGVQTVGEATTGFNVRGGSTDQNLILLNDATIYNPSHFFGFFSAFNPDIVKDVELYKSTIPEKFGGRLSSVLEVNNRDGDKKKFTGSAGIGIITSRLNIEGPIDSGKTSFIFGGRATYSNWLLKLLPDDYKNSKASFYDFNLGISHQFNENNELSVSGYYSKDAFKLNSDTNYNYSNKNASIKWKHVFNPQLSSAFTLGADRYEYQIESESNEINAYGLGFDINQLNFKSDFSYNLNARHKLNFGLSSIYYKLHPGSFKPVGNASLVTTDIVPGEQALESALYLGDEFKVSEKFSVNAGIRYSMFNYLGPQTVNTYAPNLPVTEDNQTGTVAYGKNKLIKTYQGPEFRVSARYSLANDLSIKAGYNTLRQYIHLLSNTTAIAPTDIWKLSDPNIKPQLGEQVSLGLYKNVNAKSIETSVEVYYKKLKDYLDYKSGANLVLNHHIETDVINTRGRAYGIEFLLKKNAGKLTGWMSYAYSRTELKMTDENNGPIVNSGNYYPANQDKPHAFNFTGNYAFKQRYHVSLNVTYSTGRPITLPIAKYYYAGSERVYYSERNAYRIPDYFRTDLSFNIEGNHKLNQTFHNSFTFGVYNLTGRKNAYSTYFTQENGVINGYKLSIFAAMLPFVSYNIKF